MTVLDVNHLGISFGGLQAVDEFNLAVESGEIVGLIGPNGAGKTTLFNLLTNVYKPSHGSIRLTDMDTRGKPTHAVAQSGLRNLSAQICLFHAVILNQRLGCVCQLHSARFQNIATRCKLECHQCVLLNQQRMNNGGRVERWCSARPLWF